MSWTFNEFQAELRKRNIDGPIAVVLTAMYEQQRETAVQIDMCAKLIEQIVHTVANFAALHEATQGRVEELQKRINPGEVSSEPLTDEGDYN